MSDLNRVVGYAQRWIVLHRENNYQREAAKIMQRVVDALESVRAERDAALAAVAAVRALHRRKPGTAVDWCAHCIDNDGPWPCPTVAALDGAPEPEWEVQYGRRNRETGALHWLTGSPRDDWWHENQDRYEHVKRYISPPLPVEGETA